MSHEIRTPMNSIMGMAELLQGTPLSPEQREYTKILQRSAENLLVLISDILDYAKLSVGEMAIDETSVDLRDLADSVIKNMSNRANEKGVELICHVLPDVPVCVKGDPYRLKQILLNLVDNGIKFTEKGDVALRIERHPEDRDKDALLFSVSDTGIGVPPEKLEAIFNGFTQADIYNTRKQGGSGLGLTICKSLVDLMGGKIGVKTKRGEGSAFFFSIPLQVLERRSKSRVSEVVSLKGMRILIVDDNSTNRLILRETLSDFGGLAVEMENGDKGLQELKRGLDTGQPYELLLLDDLMPGKSGLQVAEELGNIRDFDNLTVIILSSDLDKAASLRMRGLGLFYRHLLKPIRRAELLKEINEALSERRQMHKKDSFETLADTASRLLLVEDSEDNRLLLKMFLKHTRYKLDFAENGKIAVDKLAASEYDLILMDMQMPVMDGYTATRLIRQGEAEKKSGHIPIIALTAHALKGDDQKSLEAGCDAHLIKPIKRIKLLEAIEKFSLKNGSSAESVGKKRAI